MIHWIMYDISDDQARSFVARRCLQAGLYRVQLSVFIGQVARTELDELQLEIEDRIDPGRDRVYIFTMSKKELRNTVLLGQAFDKKLVTAEVHNLFI